MTEFMANINSPNITLYIFGIEELFICVSWQIFGQIPTQIFLQKMLIDDTKQMYW